MKAMVPWCDRPCSWMMNADGVGDRMIHAYWIALGLPTVTIKGIAYLGWVSEPVTFPRNHR